MSDVNLQFFSQQVSQPTEYRGVLTDTYYLHKEDFDEQDKMFGTKTGPVDLNAACVWEKPGNGDTQVDMSEIQYNIRERFGMRSVDDFNSDKDDPNEGGDY